MVEIIIIKKIRRFLSKKKVAGLLNDLLWQLRAAESRGDYFLTKTELGIIEDWKKQLKKYYPAHWVDFNWKHSIPLRLEFNKLGVWNAW